MGECFEEGNRFMPEETESGFVFPLWEPLTHIAYRDSRSAETKVGCFDNGNAPSSIDVAAYLRVGFLLLLGKQSG